MPGPHWGSLPGRPLCGSLALEVRDGLSLQRDPRCAPPWPPDPPSIPVAIDTQPAAEKAEDKAVTPHAVLLTRRVAHPTQ